MKTIQKRTLLGLGVGLLCFFSTEADAEFYIRPRAGAYVPIGDGDASYSLGVTLGYQWFSMLATEASYSRLMGNNVGGDLVQGEALVSFPLPFIRPHVSGGVGFSHTDLTYQDDWHTMLLLGAGISLPELLFLSLGAGVNYAYVIDGDDFIQPYISIGIVF